MEYSDRLDSLLKRYHQRDVHEIRVHASVVIQNAAGTSWRPENQATIEEDREV